MINFEYTLIDTESDKLVISN